MTSFTFDATIPAGPNNPSNDQPGMLTNNISTNAILAVDHVSFNSTGSGGPGSSGGQHLQVTFNSKNVPGAQTDPISTLYTTSGTASTKAELFFKNQDATLPVSILRAYGSYPGAIANGVVAPLNQFNVTSVTRSAAGTYDVVLPANVTTGTNYGVITGTSITQVGGQSATVNYQITGASTFTLFFYRSSLQLADPFFFTFTVYQT